MIGHVESYDEECQTGAIKYKNKFYEFHVDDWESESVPKKGDDVDFIPEDDGSATSVELVGAYLNDLRPVKNHYIAAILGIFFGFIGLHRLYLGFYGIAAVQIIIFGFFGAVAAVWGFIEGILLLGGQIHKDAKGRPLK